MAWDVWAGLALASGGLALALAAFLWVVGPDREPNRRLALLLFFEGTAHLSVMGGDVATAPWAVAGFNATFTAAVIALPLLYLAFLGTLDTPLTRFLRPRAVFRAMLAAVVALVLLTLARRDWFRPPGGEPDADPLVMQIVFLAVGASALFGLLVAWVAWRGTPRGSVSRRRAALYVAAFGLRDAAFGVFMVGVVLWILGVDPGPLSSGVFGRAPYFADLLFPPLVAYGILRFQLFDLDVRLKRSVSRGTVAAAFVAVFFVVAQVASEFLAGSFGYLAGGVAAGMLLFAIAPLQRAAERVAETAMPRVTASSDYLAFRKLEVYRAAVESALEEGAIDGKERAVLDRLAGKLGLRPDDARAVEADVHDVLAARAA